MNILDIILRYNWECRENGQQAADEWLVAEAKNQKWTKWFVKAIQDCFDKQGQYVRYNGEPGTYAAMLVKTSEE